MKRKKIVVIYTLVLLFLCAIYAVFAQKGYGLSCPIKMLIGIDCPGCGNTRAALALLRFDFAEMLKYNLFFPLESLYLIRVYYVCSKNYIYNGSFSYYDSPKAADIIFLCLLVIWTIVRNIL